MIDWTAGYVANPPYARPVGRNKRSALRRIKK
jgi:hypothetical protein